jgi:hypothetical protein
MLVVVHAATPPVGLIDVSALPEVSTLTQNAIDGHETPKRFASGAMVVIVHAPAPPVGLLDVRTSPSSSTTAHSEEDAHETASK